MHALPAGHHAQLVPAVHQAAQQHLHSSSRHHPRGQWWRHLHREGPLRLRRCAGGCCWPAPTAAAAAPAAPGQSTCATARLTHSSATDSQQQQAGFSTGFSTSPLRHDPLGARHQARGQQRAVNCSDGALSAAGSGNEETTAAAPRVWNVPGSNTQLGKLDHIGGVPAGLREPQQGLFPW